MTNRERFLRTMRFEKTDRLPMMEWATWWDKTVANWKQQGLEIQQVDDLNWCEALQQQMGLDVHMQLWVREFTDATPKPAFHGAGIIENAADYDRIMPTMYPKDALDPKRLNDVAARQAAGDAIAWVTMDGFFWGARELLGIEPHLYTFYDDPDLMHRINDTLSDYILYTFEQIYKVYTPDFMTFAEDMSYNLGPMLSEDMFDEFMLPYYNKVIPFLKSHGTKVFIDSDGDVTKMIPWFERAGIEGVLPLERQAGVDVEQLRRDHPNFLFIGHYDKMVMPHGEEAMRAEFERLLPAMRGGGFIPSVDHQTPPGVTFEQYKIYLKLLKEYCEKAVQ